MKKFYLVSIILSVLFQQPNNNLDSGFVGVLENFSGEPFMRMAFKKEANDWVSLNDSDLSYYGYLYRKSNRIHNWNVFYDGDTIGKIQVLELKEKKWISDIGLFLVDTNKTIPSVCNDNEKFGDWRGIPQNRPLVAMPEKSSGLSYSIDEISLSKVKNETLIFEFRKRVNEVMTCDTSLVNLDKQYYNYSDDDLLEESYSIKNDFQLVMLRLDPTLNECDGPPGLNWSTYWFLMKGNERPYCITPILEDWNAEYLDLIDVGDYDLDGKIEALFLYSSYSKSCYILFYDNFNKQAIFSWNYL